MAADISFEGINVGGNIVSWRDFGGMTAEDKQAVLNAAGFTADESNQLLGLLSKNQNIAWEKAGGGGGIGGFLKGMLPGHWNDPSARFGGRQWSDPGFQTLEDQLQSQAQSQNLHTEAGKLTGGKTDPAAAPAAQQGVVEPAMTTQALNDYYTQMMAPALANYQSVVEGDMAQWGSMINQIKKDTAGADVNFATPNLQLLGQLQNLYGQSTMLNQAFGPYLQYQNALAGQNLKIGQAHEAQGAAIQNLFQAAQSNPSLMNLLNTGGLSGLLSGTGSATIPSIMSAVNPASASISQSGQAALQQNKQTAPLGAG